jgi:transposase
MSSIRYTIEFKEMIVEKYKTGIPISKLSSEYGPSQVTIRTWNKNLSEPTENDFSDNILKY